jgi:hypothetical protein
VQALNLGCALVLGVPTGTAFLAAAAATAAVALRACVQSAGETRGPAPAGAARIDRRHAAFAVALVVFRALFRGCRS